MNICLRHRRNPENDKKKCSEIKLAKENVNYISNKYFLCKLCGVLINENEEVIK